MERPLQPFPEIPVYQAAIPVSILVFMERPLQPTYKNYLAIGKYSFNPCFYGTTSSTGNEVHLAKTLASFNPCFYGTTSSTVDCQRVYRLPSGFNPCFYGTTSSTAAW